MNKGWGDKINMVFVFNCEKISLVRKFNVDF